MPFLVKTPCNGPRDLIPLPHGNGAESKERNGTVNEMIEAYGWDGLIADSLSDSREIVLDARTSIEENIDSLMDLAPNYNSLPDEISDLVDLLRKVDKVLAEAEDLIARAQ